MMQKYSVNHKTATTFHPQTNGLVELSNREIKQVLEKTVKINRKDWALKLDDAPHHIGWCLRKLVTYR